MSLKAGVLIFLSYILLSVFAAAQTPLTTEVIDISVLVTTSNDRAVSGLGIKDFRVLEDQVLQTITSVKANKLAGDYTISYAPKNTVKDGLWRKVRVETVGFSGVTMMTQHAAGYYATPTNR
jgi:hypothetical protein